MGLIINEMVDEKRRSREERVVSKIDLEMAHNYVDLGFFLERKGFNTRSRTWMRRCISSTNFVVLLNGSVEGWFKVTRGLPLAPSLFTTAVDVLSRMLLRTKESGILELEDFLVGRSRTRVPHL